MEEMREIYRYDFDTAPGISKLLEALPDEKRDVAMLLFHRYRYSDFDLDSPFMPQFKANAESLIRELQELARNYRREMLSSAVRFSSCSCISTRTMLN